MARTRLFSALKRSLARAWWGDREEPTSSTSGVNRRDFLKASLGTAALAALPIGGAACGGGDDGPRVAVVGGGMAGLHAAYRLKQAGVAVTVFEGGSRVGGRMFSARGMFANNQVCELGGELIDTGHATMRALAEELGVTLDDLFAGEPIGYKRDTFFVGGVELMESDLVTMFTPLAAAMATTVTAAEADDLEFARIDSMNIPDYLTSQGADPRLKALLVDAYTGEYGLESSEQSVFNLLYLIDYDAPDPFHIFGDSDERYHTHLGNDTLTTLLGNALMGQIELGHKLVAAADDGAKIRLTFDTGGAPEEESFDHVVFALPFTLLRECDLTALTLSDEKRQVIAELGYGTNAKLMGGFSDRVWVTAHNASGSAITDNGLQFLWDTARGQTGASGILTNFVGGIAGVAMGTGTPEERMTLALPLIDQIFSGSSAAYTPASAVRMHWPTAPLHKGSYACYKLGQWGFYGLEGQRAGNVHFAGEHCSLDFQGFMEGACETGAMAAMEILDDLGIATKVGAILGGKLAIPQASYHGDRRKRLRWMQRRKIVRAETGRRRY